MVEMTVGIVETIDTVETIDIATGTMGIKTHVSRVTATA